MFPSTIHTHEKLVDPCSAKGEVQLRAVDDMEVSIRPGNPTDAEAAGRLFQAHLNWINVWYEPAEVVQRQSSVTRVMSCFRDAYPTSVAIAHDVVVGFAVGEMRDPYVMELFNVYVDDPYRGQGVGSRLVSAVETQAVERGVQTIMATASSYYFPGKTLPESLFRRLDFEVNDLAIGAQLYVKRMFEPPRAQGVRHLHLSGGEFREMHS